MAKGDHQAFKTIFHHYNQRLFPHVLNIVKSGAIAEEIVQETFLKLWTNKENVGRMDNPTGWLFAVASNLSINVLRKNLNKARVLAHISQQDNSTENDVLEIVDNRLQNEILNDAINKLPGQRQLVFKLSREKGLTHREIAEQLNISPKTVNNQLTTALQFLRDYMRKAGILCLATFFLV